MVVHVVRRETPRFIVELGPCRLLGELFELHVVDIFERTGCLFAVALPTCSDDVVPRSDTAASTRVDVVVRQCVHWQASTAVLTREAIAQKDIAAREAWGASVVSADVLLQHND